MERVKKKDFEKSMDRLYEIIGNLENGETPLAHSLELYKEAVETIRELQGELETATGQVVIMRKGMDGFFSEDLFDDGF